MIRRNKQKRAQGGDRPHKENGLSQSVERDEGSPAAAPDLDAGDVFEFESEERGDERQAADAAGESARPSEETEELSAVAAERDSYRDRYLRLAAEYDNFRKRTERERATDRGRAQANLVQRILDVVDDFERVTQIDPEKTSATALLEGIQMVERKLLRTLESAGLEIIDASGKPFDPEEHEALASAPTDDRDQDDTISDVFQKGYRFKGNLLRPARVRVFKHEG
jgi:molecular chaperone GrpE